MKRGIYAIYDNVAKDITGGLYLFPGTPPAVRFFADVASTKDTMISKHPQDYDLVQLGYVTEDCEMEPRYTVILKGSVWHAANSNEPDPQQLEMIK